ARSWPRSVVASGSWTAPGGLSPAGATLACCVPESGWGGREVAPERAERKAATRPDRDRSLSGSSPTYARRRKAEGVAVTPPGRGPHRPARSAWWRERGCAGPGTGVGHPPAERGGGVRHALGRATNPLADGLHRRRVRLQRRARHRVGPRAPAEARAVIPFILGAVSLGYAAGLLSGRGQGTAARPHGGHPRARFQLVAWPSR